jgi:hypothetical protein
VNRHESGAALWRRKILHHHRDDLFVIESPEASARPVRNTNARAMNAAWFETIQPAVFCYSIPPFFSTAGMG